MYCFENSEIPGISKNGITRTPGIEAVEARLHEANSGGTYSVGIWSIKIVKTISQPYAKEAALHKLLAEYSGRVPCASGARELFRISSEKVRDFFDLIDGEYIDMDSIQREKDRVSKETALAAAMTEAEKKAAKEEKQRVKAEKKAQRDEVEHQRAERKKKKQEEKAMLEQQNNALCRRFISERIRWPQTIEEKRECAHDVFHLNTMKGILQSWKRDRKVVIDMKDMLSRLVTEFGVPIKEKYYWPQIKLMMDDWDVDKWDASHAVTSP